MCVFSITCACPVCVWLCVCVRVRGSVHLHRCMCGCLDAACAIKHCGRTPHPPPHTHTSNPIHPSTSLAIHPSSSFFSLTQTPDCLPSFFPLRRSGRSSSSIRPVRSLPSPLRQRLLSRRGHLRLLQINQRHSAEAASREGPSRTPKRAAAAAIAAIAAAVISK